MGVTRRYLGGSGRSLNFFLSLCACTVLAFYGYDQGVFGGVIIGKPFLNDFGNPGDDAISTMTSVYNLGCFAGAVSTIFTGDIFGRPKTLIWGTFWILIGAIIQSSSYDRPQMYVGRIVAGFGTGVNTSTAGIYQSETAKPGKRGQLVILQMAMCIFGFSVSNWLTFGCSYIKHSAAWRFPLAFQIVFCIAVFSLAPFLPESPRLLVRKGKREEALEVIAKLHGKDVPITNPEVQTLYKNIVATHELESANTLTWLDILRGRAPVGAVRRMALGAAMQAMNQLSGINITSYYFSYVLIHAVKKTETMSRILACAASVDYLIFSLLSYYTIEHYGRRRMMMFSSAGICTCFIVITISLAFMNKGHNDMALGSVAVTFFFLFFALFALGCLGVPWLYPTEINTLQLRTKGAALATATNWITNYMVVQITPPGIANLDWKFWIVWVALSAAFVPTTYFFYPETANRTLEDLDALFASNLPPIVCRNKLATQLRRPQEFIEIEQKQARSSTPTSDVASENEKLPSSNIEHVEQSA